MTRQHTITPLVVVACLSAPAAALAAAAAATANPLLSGYGGPGQGSQAILGSALLRGSRGGGGDGAARPGGSAGAGSDRAAGSQPAGSGSADGAGTAENGASAPAETTTQARPSTNVGGALRGRGERRRSRSRSASGRPARSQGSTGQAARAGGFAAGAALYPASERATAAGSPVLGLSGEDLAFAILAFGALLGTGLLTQRMARVARPPAASAQAMVREIRVSE